VSERAPRFAPVLQRVLETVVLVLMAALAVVVVVGVGFRKLGEALVWYDEVASVLLAWLTYYGAALAALHRGHIGVPTLVDALPSRAKVPVLALAEALVIAFFVAVAWAGWRVLVVLGGTSLISLPWVPLRLTQSVIPIGAVLFIVARLTSWPRLMARARAGRIGGNHDPDVEAGAGSDPQAGGAAASSPDGAPDASGGVTP
jgi:TRAP-type C4-dicarboxylate transport system permease small subunit